MSVLSMAGNIVLLASIGSGVQWLYRHQPHVVNGALDQLSPLYLLRRRSGNSHPKKETPRLQIATSGKKPEQRPQRALSRLEQGRQNVIGYVREHPYQVSSGVALPLLMVPALILGGLLFWRSRT